MISCWVKKGLGIYPRCIYTLNIKVVSTAVLKIFEWTDRLTYIHTYVQTNGNRVIPIGPIAIYTYGKWDLKIAMAETAME